MKRTIIQARIDECDGIKARLQELARYFRDDEPQYPLEQAAAYVDQAIQIWSKRLKGEPDDE